MVGDAARSLVTDPKIDPEFTTRELFALRGLVKTPHPDSYIRIRGEKIQQFLRHAGVSQIIAQNRVLAPGSQPPQLGKEEGLPVRVINLWPAIILH